MTQEVLRQATEFERWQQTSEELEEKKRSAKDARDKVLQEVMKKKKKLLDAQSKADSLKEKCDQLEQEVAVTKARLEAMSLSSTDKAKDATI
jgi:hypothetical protein